MLCVLSPILPSTLRDTTQTAQASVIFASSSYLYYGKALEDCFFFPFLTFHTVNQARLSNRDSSQTPRGIVTTEGASSMRLSSSSYLHTLKKLSGFKSGCCRENKNKTHILSRFSNTIYLSSAWTQTKLFTARMRFALSLKIMFNIQFTSIRDFVEAKPRYTFM